MPTYGNVPTDDVTALGQAVETASRVADRLPTELPSDWRTTAYELVLEGIVNDWTDNGTTELDEEDEEDLGNLVRLAADVAMREDDARRGVTFRVLCRGAMRDWVLNWNADEEDEE